MTIQKPPYHQVSDNINQIKQEIASACQKANRHEEQVRLLAVSKTKPVEAIEAAIEAGQLEFGENYVQEGVDKIQYFTSKNETSPLIWHFIGPIQSNKTRQIATYFDWVHSIDRAKIATRLNEQREGKAPLQVLIQVNISEESSKSGILAKDMMQLAAHIHQLPALNLRGIMSIPAPSSDLNEQQQVFKQLSKLFYALKASYLDVDTLSMGMSQDMLVAIENGSTMVRIGQAIFGQREVSNL